MTMPRSVQYCSQLRRTCVTQSWRRALLPFDWQQAVYLTNGKPEAYGLMQTRRLK